MKRKISGYIVLSPLMLLLSSCTAVPSAHVSTGAPSAPAVPVHVSVSPTTAANLSPGGTQQFTATVTNSSNTAVTWSVNGVAGGDGSVGTIAGTGLYTAPATSGKFTVMATSVADPSASATATVTVESAGPPPVTVAVLTYHNNVQRTGVNDKEIILNPSNVNPTQFGKKFSYPVDGQVYAQPLYMPGLTINGAIHNVVFVATQNDSVYAFDADGTTASALWHKQLGTAAPTATGDAIYPKLGITATPVIDAETNTMYVSLVDFSTGTRRFRLHALDVFTGNEKFGGPQVVTATVNGTGYGNVNGKISIDLECYQRSAVALIGSNLYLSFGVCHHGWILGYDKTSLAQTGVFNTSPDGRGATIWMSGGGPAGDTAGNVYVLSASDFSSTISGYSNSFLKLSGGLALEDYFMPSNNAALIANDADLGSGGVIVMPDNGGAHPHEVIGGGKDGRIFIVDRDDMGKFSPTANNVVQVVQTGTQQFDNIFDTPAYWNGNLYLHCTRDVLRQFAWNNSTGILSSSAMALGKRTYGIYGATASISANGNQDGIVWEIQHDGALSGGPAVLHAYDALNVANELYNSAQAGSRDTAGPAVKFTVPTEANGKVYVGTSNQLDVYGLF